MLVRVFLPAFGKLDKLDERGWLQLDDDALLSDLLRDIKVPKALAKLLFVSVNGERAPLDTVLKDRDVVSFFWFMTGG